MKSPVTKYDEALVEKAKQLLAAAAANPTSRAFLEKYGFDAAEQARGQRLIQDSVRAFAAERAGTAWNFLSPTPDRRVAEARHWYRDRRRRWMRECARRAEEAAGFAGTGPATQQSLARKLLASVVVATHYGPLAFSLHTWRMHRAELETDLELARGPRPSDAPPPKDTVIVELFGWYERWRLLAQRVFRERPDLMAPFGLVPGKAPPRLRNKAARIAYGEKAAGSIVPPQVGDADDEPESEIPARQHLPILS